MLSIKSTFSKTLSIEFLIMDKSVILLGNLKTKYFEIFRLSSMKVTNMLLEFYILKSKFNLVSKKSL